MAQTLYALYADQAAAAAAVERLAALGISRDAIRVVEPAERDHIGSFADSGHHAHSAERDRVGSFADRDRSMPGPTPMIGELLMAGLAPAEAEEAARRLAAGSVLVVAQVPQEHVPAIMGAFGQPA